MFNGIVSDEGRICALSMREGCKHFSISLPPSFHDLKLGESVAVNGVCLTVTAFAEESFSTQAVPETLRLTNLDHLQLGSFVNLERAIKVNERISGHYVQGHVDGVGEILEIAQDAQSEALLVKISVPNHLSQYLVNKGYIALDGMSITLIDCQPNHFTVTFIGYTQKHTIVKTYQPGQLINLEVDILGKYVEKLLRGYTHDNAS